MIKRNEDNSVINKENSKMKNQTYPFFKYVLL